MHAEESALWSLDRKDGMEKAYCCFNSNARDFARFGQLLLNNGQWDGQQLISPAYLGKRQAPIPVLSIRISANPTIVTDSNTDSRLQRDEDPLYERNLGAICLHAPGKERRDRKTRAQTQRYLYRRPTLSGRYKYMVGRGDGLTSIRIYLSNDLKINAHEKNDFNDSAIGGTPIAFLRTETQQKPDITYMPQPPFNPPTYVCYKAPAPIKIDGKLSPGEWDAIPWTSDFVDIEGDKRPAPHFQTRAKMTYDDNGMYFAVLMEEPHVWATITEHDAVIFHDNDFEIFLNPTNDTHNYLEYEVNALGTEWDLFLTRPYRDNPQVLNNWEFAGMKSAVYVDGTLNNPKDTDKSWSVEVFIPWTSVFQMDRGKEKPEIGEQIRVNFSRVEWTTDVKDGKYVKVPIQGEDKIREYNWVWAPTGVINIHMPEYWGYVQISDKIAGEGETPFVKHPSEETKWILRNLYYRQNEFAATFGHYADNINDLKANELCPQEIANQLEIHTTPSMYEISLPAPDGTVWKIRQDGLVWPKKK